ncbi:MAG TPA: DUF87 domain-containing protein [Tepidisphaeraceae bacterium]|jgi:hypothetical protein|nr:DUF87 domain-containing protein [Tepidisphaeraceae bacterium]
MTDDFEKLGEFYLGREYDPHAKKRLDDLVLYDSKDLVTHAVCVGMTGSGKTGLCIGLLEEAAIDKIPAIVIDPKGDLSNLLLTFPNLEAAEFRPWINEDDAAKKGLSPDEYAAQQATFWKEGLAGWGQDGARIQKLRDAADFVIYTPGSSAGRPISILKSLGAPDAAILEDHDLLQERISTTVTSLLGLLGVDADPIQSREHILLSTIFNAAWKDGNELSLKDLFDQIKTPPFQQVGVSTLDEFLSEKERGALAMKLNNLLAAPGFASWLSGDALDVDKLLHAPSGKPKVSIFSISHLSDAERMFFVSLLLNQVIGWMRGQSGTTSLRAIVYMDEIFGYFPPVANPPSKGPLLTLMKQARAFGVGTVLATQNPVDIDYKGLANAGTWFIGRLQTERDKLRVLDGLAGASAEAGVGFDREKMSDLLSSLSKRVFLMNNVHDTGPTVFETRWTMSYLRGPLTRNQLKQLKDTTDVPSTSEPSEADGIATSVARSAVRANRAPVINRIDDEDDERPQSGATRPILSPRISQAFLPVSTEWRADSTLTYRPILLAGASVYYPDTKTGAATTLQHVYHGIRQKTADVAWEQAAWFAGSLADLEPEPEADATFTAVPDYATDPKSYTLWAKQLTDVIFRTGHVDLFKSPRLDMTSKLGESERDFRVRIDVAAREARDAATDKLRQKYAPKLAAMQERLRRAQQAVDREKAQARTSGFQTAVSLGATILGAFLGKKKVSVGTVGKATTTARGVGRSQKEYSDVGRAEETVEAVMAQQAELDAQFQAELQEMESSFDPATEPLETVQVRPKKSNIKIEAVTLAWTPYWRAADGTTDSAWE